MAVSPPDPIEFYTRLRHDGPSEQIISDFSAAMRMLLAQLERDLRRDGESEFGGRREAVLHALADAVPAMLMHVDRFEATALHASENEAEREAVRNIVANVAADHNFSGLAAARQSVPQANEAKFDQGLGGTLIGETPEMANKFNDLSTLFPPLAIIAAIIRNIGIFGRTALELSGGDEVGEQLENKLEYVIGQVGVIKDGIAGLSNGQDKIQTVTERIDREAATLEQKLLILGRLLGSTLVGEPWNIEPMTTTPNKLPARDVKQELHDIEALLRALITIITGWTPPPPDNGDPPPPPPLPPLPPTPEIPPVIDSRLKKIFVYEEGVFTPQSVADEQVIDVKTAAFDLFGWLDLSGMRSGDMVETIVSVSIAGRPLVTLEKRTFYQPGLYSLADFARGESRISGNHIRIGIRQSRSVDSFASLIELPYQFVVESQ